MKYFSVAEAREMSGMRLVLSQGVPGPWGEAAKAVFRLKNIDYSPVAQQGGGENPELLDWCGHRNAPVALYNNEPARVRWLEIVELAERVGSGPALIPQSLPERMAMVGLVNEIAGESGFAWYGRHLMLAAGHQQAGDKVLATPLYRDYGYQSEQTEQATTRIAEILDYLAGRIRHQRAQGSAYLVGQELSAADIYWAYFSQMLQSYPEPKNPMPNGLRAAWATVAKVLGEFDPSLIEQRDQTFEAHLELPMSF